MTLRGVVKIALPVVLMSIALLVARAGAASLGENQAPRRSTIAFVSTRILRAILRSIPTVDGGRLRFT
jgi:hypothetical protein